MLHVYVSKGCSYCQKVIDHLEKREVSFEKKNVSNDPAFFKEWKELNVMGTPTVYYDGDVVVGFNPKQLDELIEKMN